jgi:hypothetical protein
VEDRNCKLQYSFDSSKLKKDNTFELIITNINIKKIKVAKDFLEIRIQAEDVEIFDKGSGKYSGSKSNNSDVCFVDYKGSYKTLKPNESITYKINFKDLYLPSKILEEGNKYKMKLRFDMIDLLKDNEKCIAIDYKTEIFEIKY